MSDQTLIRSILVAVDDSQPAQWALEQAIGLAKVLGAKVSLVHVIDTAPILSDGFAVEAPNLRPTLIDEGRRMLDSLALRVPHDMLADQCLREGAAARQIIAAAHESGVDLIVIGTHGRGAIGRFLIGSVAEAVVRHAPCPVLTISHAPKDAAALPSSYATANHLESNGSLAGAKSPSG